MKKCILSLVALFLMVGSAQAQLDIFYSTSGTDANAGTELNLFEGDSASIFVWVRNGDAAAMDGLGIDMISSDASILEGTAHTIANPNNRWAQANEGDLGDLVTGSVSIALIGFGSNGIANDGEAVLHSEIAFDATAVGSTNLSIAENAGAISISGNAPNSVNFGTATVNVSVVPEPASGLVAAGVLGLAVLRRRRS